MIGNFEIKKNDLNLLPCVANTTDLNSIVSLFLCLPSFQFNTLSDFNTESAWLSGIAYQYVFPIHNIIESIDAGEDTELREGRDNIRFKVRVGKMRFQLGLVCDIDYYVRLLSYEGRELKCFFGDINGNLIGKLSGSTVIPFTIENLFLKRFSAFSSNPPVTNIYLDLSDSSDLLSVYSIKPSFDFTELYNVTCTIEDITSVDSDSFSFNVFNPYGEGITGLIASDFTVVDSINGAIAVTLVENGLGNYQINGDKDMYAGTIRLISLRYNALEEYSFIQPQYNPLQYSNQYKITA